MAMTTGETTRTFFAIAVPEPLNRKLAALQETLRPSCRDAAGRRASPFHMTLAFLGDVRNRDLNQLCKLVAASAESFEPFELTLEGLGAFPTASRPRVIWAGLSAPNLEPLLGLREASCRSRVEAGYRVDDERFHPHVTLGRIKPDRRGRWRFDRGPGTISRLVGRRLHRARGRDVRLDARARRAELRADQPGSARGRKKPRLHLEKAEL